MYAVLDFLESGFEDTRPNKPRTERPQEWYKPLNQNPKNTTGHFDKILMIRHDYEADKNNTKPMQMKRKNDKHLHSACPSCALKVKSEQIHSFCSDLKGNSDESKPMISYLPEGNDYKPVIANEIEHEIAKCHVLMDHDYHPGKETPGTEVETMSPEVNHYSSRGKNFTPSWRMNANHLTTIFVFHTLFHIPF